MARRRFVAIAMIAGTLVVATYVVAVRSAWGQRLDAAAVKGRHVLSRHDIHVAHQLHTTIDIASVALFGTAIVAVAILRGRTRLAVGVALIIVGSLATTEALKHILGRPHFGVVDAVKAVPTYPSGHTTIAMALAVSAIYVAPRRARAAIAVLGAAFASAIGCSMVVTASHRPSDPVGAAFVVTAWAAAVAAWLLRSSSTPTRPRPFWTSLSPWMALAGVAMLGAAFSGVVGVTIAMHRGSLDPIELGRAFVIATITIVGAVTACTAALLGALHQRELDRPRRARSTAAS